MNSNINMKSKVELIKDLEILQSENNRLKSELKERQKEIQLIYKLSSLFEQPNQSLDFILQNMVDFIPSSWQYPEITCARIILDGKEYKTNNFEVSKWKQSESIIVDKNSCGLIEVYYLEQKTNAFNGPFLKEEQDLLKVITEDLSRIIVKKHLLNSIKLSEKKFSVTFLKSPIAKCIVDVSDNNRFLEVNESFQKFSGFSRNDIVGKYINDINFISKEIITSIILPKLQSHKKLRNFQLTFQNKINQTKTVLLNIEIINPNKKDIAIIVINDITKIKQYENNLLRAKEKAEKNELQLKESQVMANMGSWELDVQTGLFTFTDNFYRVFKTNEKEVGHNQMTLKEYSDKFFHPEDRHLVGNAVERTMKANNPNHTEYIEHRILYTDGTTGYIGVKIFVKKNHNNKTVKIYGIIQDITSKKNNEQELIAAKEKAEESENLFRTITEQTTEGNTVADFEGNYIYVNNTFCKMSGYSKEELLKMTVFDMIPLEKRESRSIAFRNKETADGQKRYSILHRKDGAEYHTEITGTALKINKQDLIIGTIRDITEIVTYQKELIAAKEKAEESNRLKTAFLMNMSHEIRTPMNGILGFLPLLEEPNLDNKEKMEYIKIMNQSGERLMNTINDIVEISKIEIGDINIVYSEVNLEKLMNFHYNFFRQQTVNKRLNFNISKQISGNQALIKTDKYKLDSILMNLIRNAIKFTYKGTIEIGNYIQNNNLYFYVSDTGKGIPKDKINAIFDRFVQVELGDTREYEGSGIGLSIAKAYAEALNGDIHVESEIDKGSTFLLSIPYVPVMNSTTIINEKNQVHEITDLSQTILIVEDNKANFYFLSAILSKKFKLLHAINGEEAVKLFNSNKEISLILMDIKMPGKYDGFEATKIIRELNQDIPIIAQTAYALDMDKLRMIEAGFDNYILKPFSHEKLLSLVLKYIPKEK